MAKRQLGKKTTRLCPLRSMARRASSLRGN